MNRFGGLIHPSDKFIHLIEILERIVLDIVGKLTVKMNTLHQILQAVSESTLLRNVGCKEHENEITKKVISYHLIIRGHFLAKAINQSFNAKKIKTKTLRKNAKL